MSTENSLLFVGSYTDPDFEVREKGRGIYTLDFDPSKGSLRVLGITTGVVNPSYLALNRAKDRLYAVNEHMVAGGVVPGEVSSFQVGPRGALTFLNRVASQGSCPCHLFLDQNERNLFAANYLDGTVACLPVADDGTLREASEVTRHQGSGPSDRQTGPHAHMVQGSSDGRFLYSVDLGADAVFWKGGSGAGIYKTVPGAGPRHLVFHGSLARAYLVAELNATVEVLAVDRESGALSSLQTLSTVGPEQKEFAGCSAIRLSPDGRFLYAGNRGAYHSIALYRVDEATGLLTFLGTFPTDGRGPRDFVIDPTGRFLLAVNQESCEVAAWRLDLQTGFPAVKTGSAVVPTPVCLLFL